MIDGEDLFPDNWIYIHEPDVEVGRIQNFRSWSPWMVPDPDKACVGLEYFCFEGDELWDVARRGPRRARPRASSSSSAWRRREQVERGFVVRVPKAYPMYDARLRRARGDDPRRGSTAFSNLQQVGRNGLHRYNNSDHSMLTAMRAVDNVIDGAGHDIWAVNAELLPRGADRRGHAAALPQRTRRSPTRCAPRRTGCTATRAERAREVA